MKKDTRLYCTRCGKLLQFSNITSTCSDVGCNCGYEHSRVLNTSTDTEELCRAMTKEELKGDRLKNFREFLKPHGKHWR